jgi:hypothetical protein
MYLREKLAILYVHASSIRGNPQTVNLPDGKKSIERRSSPTGKAPDNQDGK